MWKINLDYQAPISSDDD